MMQTPLTTRYLAIAYQAAVGQCAIDPEDLWHVCLVPGRVAFSELTKALAWRAHVLEPGERQHVDSIRRAILREFEGGG